MWKNHPKALPFLFLSEMWERFGYYLMIGIFTLYLKDVEAGFAMTEKEALDQVITDFSKIRKSCDRWAKEYLKERRKRKIPRDQTYARPYPSKSKNKNPWITVLYKPEEVPINKLSLYNFIFLISKPYLL